MTEKSKGRKWDGKSRVSNDLYRKNYNKIFQKKSQPDPFKKEQDKLKQDIVKSVTQTSLNKKYGDLVENIIKRKLTEQSLTNKKEREEKCREEMLKEIEERNGF